MSTQLLEVLGDGCEESFACAAQVFDDGELRGRWIAGSNCEGDRDVLDVHAVSRRRKLHLEPPRAVEARQYRVQ